MQNTFGFILRRGLVFLFFVMLGLATSASAGEHGGGEGGGGSGGYEKLEPFTVNLVGLRQMIQISVTLKPAKPDVSDKIKLYMPAIRHEIILLLSSKTPEQMQSSEGKQKLILETRYAANKALGLTSKDGVADVLFESFIIQ
jgi:flagellar FliL protein